MNNTVEILTKARELISDESRWTQGEYARDEHGYITEPLSSDAKCFCLIGAITKTVGGSIRHVEDSRLITEFIYPQIDGDLPSSWNDNHTHADVLSLFDHAIELAKAGAS